VQFGSTDASVGTAAKSLLRYMLDHPSTQSPHALGKELGLLSIPSAADGSGGDAELRTWCESTIEALPQEAQAIRDGNVKVLNKLVGRVMKLSGGRAAAQDVKAVLGIMLNL
jgi:aspartyl-tRNA(Asn)/glutamyl-tRNA(Gln) amidotransferase subunit B